MLTLEPAKPNFMRICRIVPGWLNDKEHMRFSRHRLVHHTAQEEFEYINKHDVWAIFDESLQFVGTVSAAIDQTNITADLGVLIDPIKSGRGYAAEAFELLMDELRPSTRMFTAGCPETHTAMRCVCENVGMALDAVLPGRIMLDDGPVGMCCYSVKGRWTP
jgi:RimJ/RimL family protein N-acetyltransferase